MRKSYRKARTATANVARNVWFAMTMSWQVNPKLLVFSLFVYIIQALIPIATAFLAGRLIDAVLAVIDAGGADLTEPISILAGLGILQLLLLQSYNLQAYISLRTRTELGIYLGDKVLEKVASLDHGHYEDARFNKQLNKISENVQIISWAPQRVFMFATALVQLVATALTIMVLSPAIVGLLFISVTPVALTMIFTSRARWKVWDRIDERWRLKWGIQQTLTDTAKIGEIKIFNVSGALRELWRKNFGYAERERIGIEGTNSKRIAFANLFEVIIETGVAVWLLLRVVRDATFTLGDFEFYRRLLGDFANSSGRLTSSFQDLNESTLYINDLQDFLALEPAVTQPSKPLPLEDAKPPAIEFRDVTFRYPRDHHDTIKRLSFTIDSGESIALVGENGAGKTTVIKLLMRFYDVTGGEILVNGKDIKKYSLEDWYAQIGALFQQFNQYAYFKAWRAISIGDTAKPQDYTDDVLRAAQQADADKFIQQLPKKYETILSKTYEEGTDLSGGEWQRVALARAFFRNANILILDEPTAAIDAKAEYEIFETINRTQADKTTIIISHRFSTVRQADKIIVLENGQVHEQGSHEELMKLSGTYQTMFSLQAEGYK